MRILIVIGTRPEAIKLAPLVHALMRHPAVSVRVCLTGQHRELLAQALIDLDVGSDYTLEVMSANQSVGDLAIRVQAAMAPVLDDAKPDWVVVQGDTTTAMAAALAGFHGGYRVAHVEAGLRTGDISQPWPEEMNRRLIAQLASLHFAPTEGGRRNLLAEGIADHAIDVCGNTVVDALRLAEKRLDHAPATAGIAADILKRIDPERPLLLTTMHRRENLDATRLHSVGTALRRLCVEQGCQVVFPFHLSPKIEALAQSLTDTHPDLHVVPPLGYLAFVALLRRASVILTDSGGIQEEATALGKPVLIMREQTERPEAIQSGNGQLVGTDADAIVDAVMHMVRKKSAAPCAVFGDGMAADRIAGRLLR